MAKKSRKRPGKQTYFPRVRNTTLDYPGGQIQIIKCRRGKHRIVAADDVKITETLDNDRPPVV